MLLICFSFLAYGYFWLDLIEYKIADKITSAGKSKEKTKKVEEIYIPTKNENK